MFRGELVGVSKANSSMDYICWNTIHRDLKQAPYDGYSRSGEAGGGRIIRRTGGDVGRSPIIWRIPELGDRKGAVWAEEALYSGRRDFMGEPPKKYFHCSPAMRCQWAHISWEVYRM